MATIQVEGRDQTLVVTFDVALVVVRDVHALRGEGGLDRLQASLTRIRELYAKRGMSPQLTSTSGGKEAFLALIGLHLHAIAAFRAHLVEVTRRIQQEALGVAHDRLTAARREIAAEAIRYLGG